MAKQIGHITESGMGGFLNPPTHPEYYLSIRGEGFSECLSAAVKDQRLTDGTRAKALAILESWEKPPITDPGVQKWIQRVLVLFGGDAGIAHIRKFYNDYVPIEGA